MVELRERMYLAVGRCIYCGSTASKREPLTDEHIIPYALGGNAVLRQSSCRSCASITGRFEQLVLRGGLRGIKERLELSTRSKKRPKTLPIFCVNGDENARCEVEIGDYPATVILPHFLGPQVASFVGAPSVQRTPWVFQPPLDGEVLARKYGVRSWASNSMDTFSFGRMLAKIAHAFAVGEMGYGSFVPFLPDIILNDRGMDCLQFIGSLDEHGEVRPGDLVHELLLAHEVADGRRFLTCRLRLFASLGAPTYRIVLGQLPGDFNPLEPIGRPAIEADPRTANYRFALSTEEGAHKEGYAPLPPTPLTIS